MAEPLIWWSNGGIVSGFGAETIIRSQEVHGLAAPRDRGVCPQAPVGVCGPESRCGLALAAGGCAVSAALGTEASPGTVRAVPSPARRRRWWVVEPVSAQCLVRAAVALIIRRHPKVGHPVDFGNRRVDDFVFESFARGRGLAGVCAHWSIMAPREPKRAISKIPVHQRRNAPPYGLRLTHSLVCTKSAQEPTSC